MPTLFGRRSRSVSTSRPMSTSTSSPAALAASQAFFASQPPNSRLAAGAAAAALRTMSPPPMPVGQVQTKRMIERQNSNGMAGRGRSRGGVQRHDSNSSMTERTFRSPSPGRPSTAQGVEMSRQVQPPVPQVPETYANAPAIPAKSHRRSASTDEFRARIPPGTSSDTKRKPVAEPAQPAKKNGPAAAAAKRVSSLQQSPQLERQNSNGTNFSYPGRARPQSPTPPVSRPVSVASPAGISQSEAQAIERDINQVAQAPVKKKKKKVNLEGSHLSAGSMNTNSEIAQDSDFQADGADKSRITTPNNARLTGQGSHFPSGTISTSDDGTASGSESEADRVQARRAARASGALVKQPSMVREDWDGEQEDTQQSATTSTRTKSRPEDNASRKLDEPGSTPSIYASTTVAPVNRNLTTPTSQVRNASLSPSRSARFSKRLSSDLTAEGRHEPPPRSYSPMKPALKHSNSPVTLPTDLTRPRDPSQTPSEGTDVSEGTRRRRAHVSFDQSPAVVHIVPELESPTTPVLASPQNRKSKNFLTSGYDSEENEESIKPRPDLPTFDSVRNGRGASARQNAPAQSSPLSSSMISSATTVTSSDNAIGHLINQRSTQSPIPPEVTSVEGTGIASDADSVYSQEMNLATKPNTTTDSAGAVGRSIYAQVTGQTNTSAPSQRDVPEISVDPATPAAENTPVARDYISELPGSQAIYATRDSQATQPGVTGFEHVPTKHERMPSIQEDDGDTASIYSDAAEDPSELEGDGFGSINAIVRSPVAATSPRTTVPTSPPVTTPTTAQAPRIESTESTPTQPAIRPEVTRVTSWDEAQARWSGIAQTAKTASLQPSPSLVEKPADVPRSRKPAKPMRQYSEDSVDNSPVTRKPPKPLRVYSDDSIVAPSSPVMESPRLTEKRVAVPSSPVQRPVPPVEQSSYRRSNRNSQDTGARTMMKSSMRSSMDNESTPIMRSSMRTDQSQPSAQTLQNTRKTTRSPPPTASHMPSPAAAASAASRNTAPVQAPKPILKNSMPTPAITAQQTKQPLPTTIDEDDSDSSFRRRRKARASSQGRSSMRRSMRAEPSPAPVPVSAQASTQPTASQRREIRSMSPTMRRPFSPAGGQSTMRTSLRQSVDETPSMRGQNGGKRSSSLFGRRGAKSPPPTVSNGGKFQSRFADSDDEGDMRPVRGIPKKRDDDSTDLDDSSDDERKRGKNKKVGPETATPTLRQSEPGQKVERPLSLTFSDTSRRRGFRGLFRRDKSEQSIPSTPPTPNVGAIPPGPRNAESKALGFSSDAQKEALIEQTRQRLEAQNDQIPPIPGKLQRRATPSRIMSDSWPLPPKIPDTEMGRPYTADDSAARPTLGSRQPTSTTTATAPADGAAYGRSGKKKKFGLLRKAFGLKD